eukprot:15257228-Alexandrium_andersonii.AAC.2
MCELQDKSNLNNVILQHHLGRPVPGIVQTVAAHMDAPEHAWAWAQVEPHGMHRPLALGLRKPSANGMRHH